MNSRITEKFKALRLHNQKALIPYIVSGDPDLKTTAELVFTLEKAGADIIELGIPYSDPIADGVVIQRASQRALEGGVSIDAIFDTVSSIRKKSEIPIAFMLYFNSIFRYGIEAFLNKCMNYGVDGLIIPDLPLEERQDLQRIMTDYPIDLIPLVAPTSEDRIKNIVKHADGFIYCISSKGVTGTRDSFDNTLPDFINKVKNFSSLPLALGFGISDEISAEALKGLTDGLIIGSAIIQRIEQGIQDNKINEYVYDFV